MDRSISDPHSPSFSPRDFPPQECGDRVGISFLWITPPPFLSHWRHLGVLIVDGYSSLLYHPPVWFVIHLSTFLWRFEALILPAVTKIFLSFEKWVIMNWWVMFASCLRIFFLEWILGQIFNSSFSLNWGLKAVIKFHNIFNEFLLIMIN